VAIFGFIYFRIVDTLQSQDQLILKSKVDEYVGRLDVKGLSDFKEYFEYAPPYDVDASLYVLIYDNKGTLIYAHEPNPAFIVDLQELQSSLARTGEVPSQLNLKESGNIALVQTATLDNGQILVAIKNTENLNAQLSRLRVIYWWSLIPVVLIGFMGGLLLSNRALSPLRDIINSAKKIEKGALSVRVPLGKNQDEIDELKLIFNKMLDKNENLVNSLKEAFDHLAHDIRTPVTRLRGRAEMALTGEGNEDAYREALQSCFENSDKILSFLQVLTDITEAENRSRKLKKEKHFISHLVRDMMELYEMSFEEKNITVHQKLAEHDWAMVDARLISRVIANLLDNAHKYTPPGGEITIETVNQTEAVILRVSDSGPGIAANEQALIWQKLYRSDKSRSEYGMGLGLTFVKAVIESHDGKVSVRSPGRDGKGTEFEVFLQKMS
jgi:signal transduction histidine kinase